MSPRPPVSHPFVGSSAMDSLCTSWTEGTGIGLSLVHELVRLHHGSVDVASVVNKGTTVTVRLRRGTRHLPSEHVRAARRTTAVAAAAPFLEEASGWIGDEEPGTWTSHKAKAAPADKQGAAAHSGHGAVGARK